MTTAIKTTFQTTALAFYKAFEQGQYVAGNRIVGALIVAIDEAALASDEARDLANDEASERAL